ncbi:MAG: hypothetical protein Q7W45_15605 [Bacteroidota bacterium]|nr:hypothetical protein [Bacteroidota bacterium]MDP3145559.1 hypothetical protein [Bacteroidota bacterium]
MIRVFTVFIFVFVFNAGAQTSAPKSINYQGVARNAGGVPITNPFDIQFIIKDATTIVHDETQFGIQPNSLGLFSTLIGKAPNTLTLTTWNTGPFTLDVLIKSGPTFTLLGTQQLVSVPFALFAGMAGNVPTSYTNNILTIGASSYSISSGASVTPTLNGDVTGTPGNNTVTAIQNFPVSTITPTNNQILSYIGGAWTPTTMAASSLQPWAKTGNNVFLSILTDKVGIGTNIPNANLDIIGNATTTTSILQINNNNTTNTSPAILVNSTGGSAISANETSATGANAGLFNSTNGTAISGINNSSTKPAIIGQNNSTASNPAGNGVYGKTFNSHTNAAGVLGENAGGGPGVLGINNSPVAAVMGVNQFTTSINGLAHGVYGLSNNSSDFASGIFGENKGKGIGVYGYNSNSSSNNAIGVYGLVSNLTSSATAGVRGDASGVGPAVQGIGFGSGPAVNGLKPNTSTSGNAGRFEINNSSNSADALFASTIGPGASVIGIGSGSGPAVYGQKPGSSPSGNAGRFEITNPSNTDHALLVTTNGNVSGLGSAIHGIASGNSPTIYGLKPSTAGNAGKFEITNSINPSPALHAITAGSGAAMRATSGTVTASALALLIENGHIKVTGSPSFSTSAGTPTVIGGFTFPAVTVNGNDVKGMISFTTGATGFSPTNFCDIKINFGKPYPDTPTIVVTPLVDLQGLSYFVKDIQSSSFVLRLYRPFSMSAPVTTSTLPNIFNYIVIE